MAWMQRQKFFNRYLPIFLSVVLVVVVGAVYLIYTYSNTVKALLNPGVVIRGGGGGKVTMRFPTGGAPTGGLLGYWKFDEGTGATTADSSGNGNTGTLNTPAWTTGKINGALNFGGSDQVDLTSDLMASGDRTACAWVNLAAVMSNGQKRSIFDSVYFQEQYFLAAGTYYVLVTSNANNAALVSLVSSPVGVWNHICVVRPGGTGLDVDIYVNGQYQGSGNDGDPNTAFNLSIGGSSTSGFYFNGKIDEARIYNRLLSATEILNLYNSNGPQGSVIFR